VVGRTWIVLVAASALAGCSLVDAASDTGAPAAGGDGSGDDDGAPAGCALRDDFEDGVTAALWQSFNDDDAHVREVAGALEITFDGLPDSWAGYRLADTIDFTEGEVEIEVKTAGGIYTALEVSVDDMELVLFTEDVDLLIGAVNDTPLDDDGDEILYDAGAHRFWRIRAQDGVVYWEASPDGGVWDTIHTQDVPFPLDAVTILVEAGGGLGDPGAAIESFSATPTGCAE